MPAYWAMVVLHLAPCWRPRYPTNIPLPSITMSANPHLNAFKSLIGVWTTVGRHPMLPGMMLHGRTAFEWQEGGAFLVMRSEIDEPGIPSAIAIIGSDDQSDSFDNHADPSLRSG
jgi:hypothetical protein